MYSRKADNVVRDGRDPKAVDLIDAVIQVPVKGKKLEFGIDTHGLAAIMSQFYESKIPPNYKIAGVRCYTSGDENDGPQEIITEFDLIPE